LLHRRQIFDWKHHALVLISYVKNLRNRRSLLVPLRGFTLAEVLITLGIIGVVAALTIPTLMQEQRKIATQTALKKFYSQMSNAIKLSEVENGSVDKWEKEDEDISYNENSERDFTENTNRSERFFLKYLAPYLKYTKTHISSDGHMFVVDFADGSTVSMHNGGCLDMNFDANGNKLPNEPGKDIYRFTLCFNEQHRTWFCGKRISFCPMTDNPNGTRSKLLSRCNAIGGYCAKLLEYDGWEFKDDYPYKF
ncbi:type II secretion system protein, partial [bacterium]|nr:type II secretion system protein [bacterium]